MALVAGNDALVRVWHGSSGSLLATLRGGTEPMLSVDLYGEWALAGRAHLPPLFLVVQLRVV